MRRLVIFALTLVLSPALLSGQDKTVIVVRTFTVASDIAWPYDMKQMRLQTLAELKAKLGAQYDVVADDQAVRRGTYILEGEVLAWRPGNRAKRILVGMGSGREAADIHFWLSDETGKKLVDRKDTVRAEFWGNAYEGSVGQLAHPFADKIAGRIKDAKLN